MTVARLLGWSFSRLAAELAMASRDQPDTHPVHQIRNRLKAEPVLSTNE